MTIAEYLASAKARLLADPAIARFVVWRERTTSSEDGLWRVRVWLADGSTLEFSEYVRILNSQVTAMTYSYHWADANATLICRWDNTPHFPSLTGFPHHVHAGPDGAVHLSQPTGLFAVLDEITRRLIPISQEY